MELKNIDLSKIINNIGIADIYEKKEIIFNKKITTYYEYHGKDLGVCLLDDSFFISLKNFASDVISIKYSDDEDFIAFDFKKLSEYKGSEVTSDKYDIFISNDEPIFFYYNEDEGVFKPIINKELLEYIEETKQEEKIDIASIYESIKKTIISQDEQVMKILVSIYKNQKVINSPLSKDAIGKLKENIIVYGSTGTGKTEILRQIAKMCDVPIVIEDATSFTETGYVGRDVSDMLRDLYVRANYDLLLAQKGILVIDEFDKLGIGGNNFQSEGPSREGVQRSLLKLLDGGTVSFSEDGLDGDTIDFDTTYLTVVALGAFAKHIDDNNKSTDMTMVDFTEYGIMPEIMGRFSKLVAMNSFNAEDLKRILLESDLSPFNTYSELFKSMNIEFDYDEDLIDYIVDEAMALNLGARSLKTVFDNIISDRLFDVFANKPKSLHLTKPTDESKSFASKAKKAKCKKNIGFR